MRYAPTPNPAFRHEALIYRSEEEFLAGTVRFVRDAVAAGEPVLVAVSPEKAGLISARLNGESEHVFFADMPQLGRNPARIIPVWREFVAEHLQEGSPVRGIGEPIWPERSPAELVECQRHEWLLNLAFADAPAWWLLCPYDAAALDSDVLETAYVTHPYVANNGHRHASSTYCDPLTGPDPFHGPLPPPAEKPDGWPSRWMSCSRSGGSSRDGQPERGSTVPAGRTSWWPSTRSRPTASATPVDRGR